MKIHWNWGTAAAGAYILFVAGTLSMVALAMERPVDLVSPEYYADSLKQDQRMAATAHAAALGATASATVDASAHAIVVALPATATSGATGTVTLYRPSNATADQVTPLTIDRSGTARLPTEGLMSGRWLVKVEWTAQGTPYYLEQAITIP